MRWFTAGVMGLALLAGCGSVVPGIPESLPRADPSASLPFRPLFLERTNDRNDGSSFEPCIAFADPELARLGIEPNSVKDAAFSDSPNFRGCEWRMPAGYPSQFVSNQGSLASYLDRHSDVHWHRVRVHERTIASGSYRDGQCSAVFKSQGAVVITMISAWKAGKWPGTACEWVVEFASLAASRAP